MLIKVDSIENRHLRRLIEHSIYICILIVFIPGFFYFEICIVIPTIMEQWSAPYVFYLFGGIFVVLNIVTNLIYGSFTDTSIKGKLMLTNYIDKPNWTFCTVCESMRPPRAWHCEHCNICVLKRDHHCTFFAYCVGYYNHRYFMYFTFYIFNSMVSVVYLNIRFLSLVINWNHGLIIAKFIFPLAFFVIDFGYETVYVFMFVMNVIIGAFTGFLFFYHLRNILKGITKPESKHSTKEFLFDNGWKSNVVEVFGTRWYLTWILPSINSPLPGNGMEWICEDKNK